MLDMDICAVVSSLVQQTGNLPLQLILLCLRHGNNIQRDLMLNHASCNRKLSLLLKDIPQCDIDEACCNVHVLGSLEYDANIEYAFVSTKLIPLATSSIWKLQQQYYRSIGQDAWDNNTVPFNISSNSYIAQYYLRCIMKYVLTSKSKNVCIIEIGSGQ